MSTPWGAAAASFHNVTGFSVQPEDIVFQCGAQLAYLLTPAHNEPVVNGLETLAAVSGTARAGVCACVCVSLWKRAQACVGSQWPHLLGHSSNQEMRWESFSKKVVSYANVLIEIGQIRCHSFLLAFALLSSDFIFSSAASLDNILLGLKCSVL